MGATVPGSSLGRVLGRLLAESWPVGERVLVESATPGGIAMCVLGRARDVGDPLCTTQGADWRVIYRMYLQYL